MFGDFVDQTVKNIPDNSVDLIFTDPPYGQDNIPVYGELGNLAARVLKDRGSLLCYAGNYALPDICQLVMMKDSHQMSYWWTISVLHGGNIRRMHKQKVWPYWKPILWFVKGQRNNAPNDIRDLIESKPVDKSLHPWRAVHGRSLNIA